MALTVGTDTYASLADVQSWLTSRGSSLTATPEAILRAMDYLEAMPWIADAPDDGLFWGDDPPDAVVKALYMATKMELGNPGALMPESTKGIKREKLDVLEVEYLPGQNNDEFVSIKSVLRGLIRSGCVVRLA